MEVSRICTDFRRSGQPHLAMGSLVSNEERILSGGLQLERRHTGHSLTFVALACDFTTSQMERQAVVGVS